MKNKKLLFILIPVFIVLLLIIILIRGHMSNLEKELLKENSYNIMLYMDSYINNDSKDIDRYILYALDYSYNENNKEELKSSEIKEIIETIFDINISKEKINKIGITPLLLDRNVIHNPEEEVYKIDRSSITQRQIADIPIILYKDKSIKKSGSKYIVKYNKIKIDNPYEILNYYSDLNNPSDKSNNKKKNKTYDTSKIMNYLTAKGKIKDVKLAVNDEIIKKSGKVDKKLVTVIYKLKGTKFYISEIKN